MARYKPVDRSARLLPVVLSEQRLPGSFEFALDHLVDHELDLSPLDARFCNDATGAPAYDPRVMLKIVLLGYSRGLISSRAIERACRQNVQFIALSGDAAPSYTHLAKFVRELGDAIRPLFLQVLLTCDRLGLIGKSMFAIDGVKLPSNASKECSGTPAELLHRAQRLDQAAAKILAAHRERDQRGDDDDAPRQRAVRFRHANRFKMEDVLHDKRRPHQSTHAHAVSASGLPLRPLDQHLCARAGSACTATVRIARSRAGSITSSLAPSAVAYGVPCVSAACARAAVVQPAHCHGGAGVREPQAQQAVEPLHAQRTRESGHAMAVVLSGAQHREDRACAAMRRGEARRIARNEGTESRPHALDRRSELGNTGRMNFHPSTKAFGLRAIALEKRVFAQSR